MLIFVVETIYYQIKMCLLNKKITIVTKFINIIVTIKLIKDYKTKKKKKKKKTKIIFLINHETNVNKMAI